MIKDKKYRVVLTCWDHGCKKPYVDKIDKIFETFDDAISAVEIAVNDELNTLNEFDTDSPREKCAIEDSDGNIVGYDYPFRADFYGNDACIIRFWDGDDYQPVTAYNVYEISNCGGYFVYRDFEIYPNKKGNRFKVTDYNDYFGTTKHKFETALDWIDDWLLMDDKCANLLLHFNMFEIIKGDG